LIAQEERQYAIKSFKSGAKDVMVASGVASKGLDFSDIQHVIIFSMPKEIEDYVHQIGRTGRSGKTGIATTFVNMNTPEQTLLDLKYLLMEAGQKSVCSGDKLASLADIKLIECLPSFHVSTILVRRRAFLQMAALFAEVGIIVDSVYAFIDTLF
jgi:superfamily II DNA/RNA helicase